MIIRTSQLGNVMKSIMADDVSSKDSLLQQKQCSVAMLFCIGRVLIVEGSCVFPVSLLSYVVGFSLN